MCFRLGKNFRSRPLVIIISYKSGTSDANALLDTVKVKTRFLWLIHVIQLVVTSLEYCKRQTV